MFIGSFHLGLAHGDRFLDIVGTARVFSVQLVKVVGGPAVFIAAHPAPIRALGPEPV